MLITMIKFIVFAVTFSGCLCHRHHHEMDSDMQRAMSYLSQYHYIGINNPDPHVAELIQRDPLEATRNGILLFQKRYSLNETGSLTQETLDLMAKPRCGLPDIINMETRRQKRYAVKGGTWDDTVITYKVSQYTQDNDLTPKQINEVLRKAFNVWEEVTPLRFIQKTHRDRVDIDIRFAAKDHGDGFAFDGPGSVLAHAFYPMFGGDTHFDEAEVWTIGTHQGTNLFQVATHEFGHALGLAHSDNPISLMAPFYQGYQPNFILPEDDVRGIQSLYGPPLKKTTTSTTTTTTTVKPSTRSRTRKPKTTTPKPTTTAKPKTKTTTSVPTTTTTQNARPLFPDMCKDGKFDAITLHLESGRKHTYVFKDNLYVKIKNKKIAHGYPRQIKYDWPGLPNNIDAALFWDVEYKNYWKWNALKREYELLRKVTKPARTYFFKGDKYWRFEHRRLVPGYPKDLISWGVPPNIDAAFVWSGNGMTYFVKGNKYYRYTRNTGVDKGYPRLFSVWKGLPDGIDTAFQYIDGSTYFFKGRHFYKFHDTYFKVDGYSPKTNSEFWLGCNDRKHKNYYNQLEYLTSSASHMDRLFILTLITFTVVNLLF